MTRNDTIRPEFSVVVDLEELPDGETAFDLAADAAERAALAKRFGLISLDRFEAQLAVEWVERDKVLALRGRISADVVQSCVVTLEPVPNTVSEAIDLLFARDAATIDELVDPDEAEPLEGDSLDIGEIAAEELSLSLDPYPRAPHIDPSALNLGPGASLKTEEEAAQDRTGKNSPFAVLESLKSKL